MRHLICLLGSLVMALGLTVPTSAATFNYDFTMPGVSGVISFDDVTDGSRTSTRLEVISNRIDLSGNGIYDPFETPLFTFSSGNIVSASGSFELNVTPPLIWFLFFDQTSDEITRLELMCVDRFFDGESFGKGCAGRSFESTSASDLTSSIFTQQLTPIPLPAGLPLLITGLAAFAGLRMRKKRAAQV